MELTREELLDRLGRLRRSTMRGGQRAPHKPLLLLWLLSRLARNGSSEVRYADAEQPVNDLIIDFGPARIRAGWPALMPFVHLETELWTLHDGSGSPIGKAPERRRFLLDNQVTGRLRPEVERLLADPATLAATARLLLDNHFTPSLAELISNRVGLDLADLAAAAGPVPVPVHARRDPDFADRVLLAYAYRCAVCGFDGRIGRHPVGLEAAHVHWHSQGGPSTTDNGVALCVLHHTLLDLGVLGITAELTVRVSPLYVAAEPAGTQLYTLAGQPFRAPIPSQPTVGQAYVAWHTRQVFKDPAAAA